MVDGAPLTLSQTVDLRDSGQLLQALRYDEDYAYVVVKVPANSNLKLPLAVGAVLHSSENLYASKPVAA